MTGSDTIVTIDGPAGVGKSSVCRLVAAALGFSRLDTGAMYRAVALKVMEARVDYRDPEALSALLAATAVEFTEDGGILLDSKDVSSRIRTAAVASFSSELAAVGEVRKYLVEIQRKIGRKGNIVAEGRDMGTYVFPRARYKFYLDASPEERAKRRFLQGGGSDVMETEREIRERDRRDSSRTKNPLRPAPDAVIIDTTRMSEEEVVEEIVARTDGVSARSGKK